MTLEYHHDTGSIAKLTSSASTGRLPDKVQDSARTLTPSHSLDSLHKTGRLVLASHLWNGIDSPAKLAPPFTRDATDEEQTRTLGDSSSVASLLSVASDSVTPPSRPPPSSQLNTGSFLRRECSTTPGVAGYVSPVVAEHVKSIEGAHKQPSDWSRAPNSNGKPAPHASTKVPTANYTVPAQSTISPLPHQHVPTPTWVIEEVIEFCPPADDTMIHECDAVSFARQTTSIMFDGCYRHPCFDDRCERRPGHSDEYMQERSSERRPNLQEI